MAVTPFSQHLDVAYVVPADTARMIADRAWEMWGTHGADQGDRRSTTVVVWERRRGLIGAGAVPTGSFSIAWHRPVVNQASITRLAWDPEHGGTEELVRRAINSLAGWPVARDLARR